MPDLRKYYPRKNSEGYLDPTVSEALGRICQKEDEDENVHRLISTIKTIADLAGFTVTNRIELKNKETGRIYR